MPLELESKIAVPSHDPLREKLRTSGASPQGRVLETNRLFDNADRALFHAGCGLRVRTAKPIDDKSASRTTFTFKGPQEKSTFKRREEIELAIESAEGMTRLLAAIGYTPWLLYEKRRESWTLGPCHFELDEIPQLGRFVECEGPDDDAIHVALAALGLAGEPLIAYSYPALMARHFGESAPRPLTLRCS
jgi:predicted adenylyl cyclase CyaB